jgi:hypothetical protein
MKSELNLCDNEILSLIPLRDEPIMKINYYDIEKLNFGMCTMQGPVHL